MVLKKYYAIILLTFRPYNYYEENFSTKQPQKKKNPWVSCENGHQGW